MRYPVLIEQGSDTTAWGVVVPDLPGCFSAGDTLDEAMCNAEEAAAGWIDTALDEGLPVPGPSSLEDMAARPEYHDWRVGVINLDPALLDDTTVRINVSLPARVLKRLDAKVRDSGARDRSSYIARMTLD